MRVHHLLASFLVLALALPGAGIAQSYPTHPLRLVVPYTPGGGELVALARQMRAEEATMWAGVVKASGATVEE